MDLHEPWRLSDVFESSRLLLPWEMRLEIVERVTKVLSDLHGKDLSYGSEAVVSKHIYIKERHIFGLQAMENYPQVATLTQKDNDIFACGVLMVEMYIHGPVSVEAMPTLQAMIEASDSSQASLERRESAISYLDTVVGTAVSIFNRLVRGEDERTDEEKVEEELRRIFAAYRTPNQPAWLNNFEEIILDCVVFFPKPDAQSLRKSLVELLGAFKEARVTSQLNESAAALSQYYSQLDMDELERSTAVLKADVKLYHSAEVAGRPWNEEEEDNVSVASSFPKTEHHETTLTHEVKASEPSSESPMPTPVSGGAKYKKVKMPSKAAPPKVVPPKPRRRSVAKDQEKNGSGKNKTRTSVMRVSQSLLSEVNGHRKAEGMQILEPDTLARLFDEQERLQREQIVLLLNKAKALLRRESNILSLDAPASIIGDLHGQYFDLRNLLDLVKTKNVSDRLLFLGDYVDRGKWSCETFFYILRLKIERPESVFMIRGNHESDSLAAEYGFRAEVDRKYGREVYHRCLEVFKALPIACFINLPNKKRFLAVHGGISDKVKTLEDIQAIDRFVEPPLEGVLCDILWSDPVSNDYLALHKEVKQKFEDIQFLPNPVRGCAQSFGYAGLCKFLETNDLLGLIRAHEAVEEGFEFHFQNVGNHYNIVATVFSAPNYMKSHGNKGAVLAVHTKPVRHAYVNSDTPNDAPICFLEPFSFSEVAHPVVKHTGDETITLMHDVEQFCPYLSRDVQDFYDFTLDILEYFGDAAQQLEDLYALQEPLALSKESEFQDSQKRFGSSRAFGTNYTQYKNKRASAGSHVSVRSLMSIKGMKANNDMSIFASNKSLGTAVGALTQNDLERDAVKRMTLIDEVHPDVLKARLESTSQQLVEKLKNESKQAKAKKAKKNSVKQDVVVGSVTFSPKEREVIQLVFFTIDRYDAGAVGQKEIRDWALEEGYVLSDEDATSCISAIDYDGDDKIGISDFFLYAAKLKEDYQIRKTRFGNWYADLTDAEIEREETDTLFVLEDDSESDDSDVETGFTDGS